MRKRRAPGRGPFRTKVSNATTTVPTVIFGWGQLGRPTRGITWTLPDVDRPSLPGLATELTEVCPAQGTVSNRPHLRQAPT
eukprot:2871085-Rhodomonas_salina.1